MNWTFDDCPKCRLYGHVACQGHPVRIDQAVIAELRMLLGVPAPPMRGLSAAASTGGGNGSQPPRPWAQRLCPFCAQAPDRLQAPNLASRLEYVTHLSACLNAPESIRDAAAEGFLAEELR